MSGAGRPGFSRPPRSRRSCIMLDQLYPSPVATMAGVPTDEVPLLPEEAEGLERAVPARRREFAVGRECARAALRKLGVSGARILRAADRSPVWPRGVVGSISHCAGFCGAAVAKTSEVLALGLDVECLGRLAPESRSLICSRSETKALARRPFRFDPVEAAFSAKESFYKAYHPRTGFFLDFLDVRVDFNATGESFEVEILRRDAPSLLGRRVVGGRLRMGNGRVLTGVAIKA